MIARWIIRNQLHVMGALSTDELELVACDAEAVIYRYRCQAPMHVRLGLFVLAVAFSVAWLVALAPRPEDVRAKRLMRAWNALPNPAPQLIRFYASLAWLRACEHPLVAKQFGFPDVESRFRRKRIERNAAINGRNP